MNCAQAVAKAFQPVTRVTDEFIDSLSGLGAGRAPEGLCGALYSGLLQAADEESADALKQVFQRESGSTKCREISSIEE